MIKATEHDSWRFCLILWKHEKWTDSYNGTKVQSKGRDKYRCMQVKSIE